MIGSRLKPGAFKLWVKWIQLALPHLGDVCHNLPREVGADVRRRGVVAQAEFEAARFEIRIDIQGFKGKGLKPVAFNLWVNRVQLAPPHLGVDAAAHAPEQRDGGPSEAVAGEALEQLQRVARGVAAQELRKFEEYQRLEKPGFGYTSSARGLKKPGGFELWVVLDLTCTQPPPSWARPSP